FQIVKSFSNFSLHILPLAQILEGNDFLVIVQSLFRIGPVLDGSYLSRFSQQSSKGSILKTS
ncbi:MAG: hypothetical protein ACJ709_04030, partial [Nitrososphaeraceae archaeon]